MSKASIKKVVYDWVVANQGAYHGLKVTNKILARHFMRDNPEFKVTNSIETVLKYVTKTRSGEITQDDFNDIESAILENIQTASVFMIHEQPSNIEVDLDPLGLDEHSDINRIFFDVPETYASHLSPMKIECDGLLGIASDMHFPIHNREAVLACFGKFKELGIKGLYLNGDIIDCASVGHHDKRKVLHYTWDQELAVARAFLKSLRVLFPTIPIWYKSGNHEDWLPRYLAKVAPQLGNEYGLAEALGLKDLNIQYVESSRVARFGSLWVVHGHEVGLKGGGVNIARALLMRTNVNIIAGHWHKNDQHERRNLDESVVSAWVTGCLSDLHPDYAPNNQMTHGFATVELTDDKGGFAVRPYKIIHGRVVG